MGCKKLQTQEYFRLVAGGGKTKIPSHGGTVTRRDESFTVSPPLRFSDSSPHLPTYDGNGNIMAYVDSSTGAKAAEYEYDPFGKEIYRKETAEVAALLGFEHRFSTKPVDAVTGYLYYGHRHYIPGLGIWANRDPIGEEGGNNLYGFVSNDGVNRWDYLGMEDYSIVDTVDIDYSKSVASHISNYSPDFQMFSCL